MQTTDSRKILILVIIGLIGSFSFGVKNLITRFKEPTFQSFSISEVNEKEIANNQHVIIKDGYINGDGIYKEVFATFASDVTFPVIDTSNFNIEDDKIPISVIVRNNKDLSVCISDSSCIQKGFYDIIGKVFSINDLNDEELSLLRENYKLLQNCIYIKTAWEKPGILINILLTLLPFMFVYYFRKAIFQKKDRFDTEDFL